MGRVGVVFLILFTLVGCSKEKKEGIGRYGMLDDDTPQYTAVMFMQSLYYDDNIDNILGLSTERMARVLKRYHTNRNVQRHVLNLMYDEVTVQPESSGGVGRMEFAQKATVVLIFSGFYHDEKIDDIRTIELVKDSGDWKVDNIQADRFL